MNRERRVSPPVNEPNLTYLPGSPERAELKARLSAMASERIDIPLVVGGRDIRTGRLAQAVMPHDHHHVLADWHQAEPQHVEHDDVTAPPCRRCAVPHPRAQARPLRGPSCIMGPVGEQLSGSSQGRVTAFG